MTESLTHKESGESEQGPVDAQIGWMRRATYATVNGLNDAAQFAGTAAAYTLGRTVRTVGEAAGNVMKGARGGRFGQTA